MPPPQRHRASNSTRFLGAAAGLSLFAAVAGTPPVPRVEPWRIVPVDPDYGGAWIVAGDLDGDHQVELVSARNVDQHDVHYTSAVVAQRLDGSVMWRWGNPAVGRKQLHHDVACQIHDWDGDGLNEVILCAEAALVELDGATGCERRRFPLPKDATDCLVFADLTGRGRPTEAWRLVLTMCGANAIALLDGNGKTLWEVTGQHFESVDVGRILPDTNRLQFAVDIDHRPWGEGPIWVLDEDGTISTRIMTDYARHHVLLDWTGDGLSEILVAQSRTLYDARGRPVATLAMDPQDDLTGEERLVHIGDFTGDGVPDVLLGTRALSHVRIYKNERGRTPTPPAPLGTGLNVALY